MAGILSPVASVRAEDASWVGSCLIPDVYDTAGKITMPSHVGANETKVGCEEPNYPPPPGGGTTSIHAVWTAYPDGKPITGVATGGTAPTSSATGNVLDYMASCDLGHLAMGSFDGCIEKFFYYTIYSIPAFFLVQSANFFNALVAIGLSSSLYNSSFVPTAWAIVRDLSNIFFILVLLYVAIQMILDIGGHDVKKMIAKVIIMALLINFSMFFTGAIIDSSNILALIFYNKLDVSSSINGTSTPYVPITNTPGEKDISGGMVKAFDITTFLRQDFFEALKKRSQIVPITWTQAGLVTGGALLNPVVGVVMGVSVLYGHYFPADTVPMPTILAILIIAGLIMGFAAYTFFIAGFAFLSRLIELWVLIIFSPFAFMSSTIPILEKIPDIGWDDWLKRLFKASFMAPIFMFFMYFIFLLVKINIFASLSSITDPSKQTVTQIILLIFLPAILILTLLLKAAKFAKTSSGAVGEMVFTGVKIIGGLALGGAALGTAAVARGGIGAFMKGASTGETAGRRLAQERTARAAQAAAGVPVTFRDPGLGRFARLKGQVQLSTGYDALQQRVGARLNTDQAHIEHARHARHELDTAASAIVPGKKWEELNGEQRYQARRKLARERVVRDNKAAGSFIIDPATGAAATRQVVDAVTGVISRVPIGAFGTRNWDALSDDERTAIDASAEVGNNYATGHAIHHGALDEHRTVDDMGFVNDARRKQGIISNVVQSTVTGSYDVRNLANVGAREQTTGMTKLTAGIIGAVAMGMRSGFKGAGINHGEGQGNSFKDLGNILTEALKNVKINVDLSHVGEVKKEDGKKGGGGHH